VSIRIFLFDIKTTPHYNGFTIVIEGKRTMGKMFVKALLLALLILLIALLVPSPTPVAIGEGRISTTLTTVHGAM